MRRCGWFAGRLSALLLAVLLAPGCGSGSDSLPRQAVSGRVTVDGKPLEQGTIQFMPASPGGADTTSGGADIEGGAYSIPRAEGLVPGSYKVMIYGKAGAPQPPADDEAPGSRTVLPPADMIPAQYNAQTTLNAEVKPDVTNEVNFDLKSK